MNILVGRFKDKSIRTKIASLSKIYDDIILFNILSCDATLDVYNENDIDIVIIDFSDDACRNILDEIVRINPFQKTITISNEIECSDKNGCVHCLKNFNRKRLLNTFNNQDLYYLIKNFDSKQCMYFNSFTDIFDILEDILKRFSTCSYDKSTKIINVENTNEGMITLLEVINILNQHNVKYEIKDITTIQLRHE